MDRDFWGIAIPWLALVVSAIALVISARLSKRQNELQEQENALQARLVELEERRDREERAARTVADLTAEVVHTVYGGDPRRALRITNRGGAAARSLEARINGQPIGESAFSPWDRCVSELQRGSRADYLLSDVQLKFATSGFTVDLTWSDESGMLRHANYQLSST